MKACVYGGHFGSEGKGSLAEYLAQLARSDGSKLAVFGENSPNSGHTCRMGKTRNLPAASYYADVVILGPDSVVCPTTLRQDLEEINKTRKEPVQVYIHENAAVLGSLDIELEQEAGVIERVSSTGSGSGAARFHKQFLRHYYNIVGSLGKVVLPPGCSTVNHSQWFDLLRQLERIPSWIFECSQGSLLDVNWGYYPYVTSRTTLPRCAIERNGLGDYNWRYYGVYRTYPIRTGGPSGPTGKPELDFEKDIGKPAEIATVTKRKRRVFQFCPDDFMRSIRLTRPHIVAFTHLDYIPLKRNDYLGFLSWLRKNGIDAVGLALKKVDTVMLSDELGEFYHTSL